MKLPSTAIFREGVKGKQRPFRLQLCASHGRTFAWHFRCGLIDGENAPHSPQWSVCDVRDLRHRFRAYFEIKTSRWNSAWSAFISSFLLSWQWHFIRFKGHVMHKTFIIGSIFNDPLQTKTAFLGPLRNLLQLCADIQTWVNYVHNISSCGRRIPRLTSVQHISILVLHLIFHRLPFFNCCFVAWKRGLIPKIRINLCFILISNSLFNLLSVWESVRVVG